MPARSGTELGTERAGLSTAQGPSIAASVAPGWDSPDPVDFGTDLAELAEEDGFRSPIVWYRRVAVQRRLRLVGRLSQMGPAEIVHRLRKRARKGIARRRTGDLAPLDESGARALLPPAMATAPADYLLQRTTVEGFFDLTDRDRLAARAQWELHGPAAGRERTLHEADALLRHGVQLLGKHFRPADPKFDWLADPDAGRVLALIPMDDADAVRGQEIDVKFVWEVNRHQFLVTLARAYAYSGDERYATECVGMIRRWIAQNPAGQGVNWSSNLELAIRSLSWVWVMHFLLGSRALAGGPDLTIWLASLLQHRDHLARDLTIYTDRTNHLIGEVCALSVLSMWFPEWDRSDGLGDLAKSVLARELECQVGTDGVDREQATSYQRFVLELVLQVVLLADRNGVSLPEPIESRARAMLDAVRVLANDNDQVPHLGDSDDARGLPFCAGEPWDFGDLISTAEAVLDGTTQGRRASEAALWVAGGRSTRRKAGSGSTRGDSDFLPSGFAVLRNPANRGDRLIFDCGPLGLHPHASHGHADLLSVLVDVDGASMLVDRGTFAYTADEGLRNRLRATRAHNTVEVGGRDQAVPFDPFKWLNLPRVVVDAVDLQSDVRHVEAWHDGYSRLRPAVIHRRAVLGVHSGWLLVDWLQGTGRQRFSRWFHAAPDATVEQPGTGTVTLRRDSAAALVVEDLVDHREQPAPIQVGSSPHSESYRELVAAPTLRLAEDTQLPAVRLTLLAVQRGDAGRLRGRAERRPDGSIAVHLRAPGAEPVFVEVRPHRRRGEAGLSIVHPDVESASAAFPGERGGP